MKKFILLLSIYGMFVSNFFSQDIIYTKSQTEIKAKVLEITTDAIKYKEYDFIDGPTRNIAKSNVFMIEYSNGKKEFISKNDTKEPEQKYIDKGNNSKSKSSSESSFGFRAGLNLVTFSGRAADDLEELGFDKKTLPSFNVGLVAEFGVSESFFIESGLYLSSKGLRAEYINPDPNFSKETFEGTLSISYLEVPLSASFKVELGGVKLNVFAGPYLGIAIAGKNKVQTSNEYELNYGTPDTIVDLKFGTTENDNFKRTDLGLNFGAGLQIENFVVRAQYGLGFTNLDPKSDNDGELKNRVISVSAAYMF